MVFSSGEYAQRVGMLREANGLGNPIPKPPSAHGLSGILNARAKQCAVERGTWNGMPQQDTHRTARA